MSFSETRAFSLASPTSRKPPGSPQFAKQYQPVINTVSIKLWPLAFSLSREGTTPTTQPGLAGSKPHKAYRFSPGVFLLVLIMLKVQPVRYNPALFAAPLAIVLRQPGLLATTRETASATSRCLWLKHQTGSHTSIYAPLPCQILRAVFLIQT